MTQNIAVLPLVVGMQQEGAVPGARAPGGGDPADEGAGFPDLLRHLLAAGTLAPMPVLPQAMTPEAGTEAVVSAPVNPAGPGGEPLARTVTPEGTGTLNVETQMLSIARPTTDLPAQDALPGLTSPVQETPPDVQPESSLPSAGMALPPGGNSSATEEAVSAPPIVDTGRKVATTQPAAVAAMMSLLEDVEPVRNAEAPAAPYASTTSETDEMSVDSGEMLPERLIPERNVRETTRPAVAEGTRNAVREISGRPGRTDGKTAAVTFPPAHEVESQKHVASGATLPDGGARMPKAEVRNSAPEAPASVSADAAPVALEEVVTVRRGESVQGSTQAPSLKHELRDVRPETTAPAPQEPEATQPRGVPPSGAMHGEGESRDDQSGRMPFSHGHAGVTLVQSHVTRDDGSGSQVSDFLNALPPETARSVVDQLVKELAMHVRGDNSEMRIKLEPDSLGEVVVRVRMENGKMEAQIDVSQLAVKSALEVHLGQLRQSLSARGIEVQRLDVLFNAGNGARESGGGQGDRYRRHGSRNHPAAEAVGQYQTGRQLGYNTIEMVM